MANIEINTTILREQGMDMLRLTNELQNVLDEFYKRINHMPEITGEWVGTNAEEFVRRANIDKKQYYKLKDECYQYGKVLTNLTDSLDGTIAKMGR